MLYYRHKSSNSAHHRGACGASEAQGLRLRTAPFCGRCEGAEVRERAHGRQTRRAAAVVAISERDASGGGGAPH